jgi:hypothetical protein
MKHVKKSIDEDLKVKNLKPKYWSVIRHLDKEMIILRYGSLGWNGSFNEYTGIWDRVYLGVWKYGELTKENIKKHASGIDWQLGIPFKEIEESEVLFLM